MPGRQGGEAEVPPAGAWFWGRTRLCGKSCLSQKRQREVGRRGGCGRGVDSFQGVGHSRLVRPGFLAKDLRRLLCFLWSQARCWELAPSLRSAADCCVITATHLSSPCLSLPAHELPPVPQQCWGRFHGLSHLMAPSLSSFICRVGCQGGRVVKSSTKQQAPFCRGG